jgi:hypothetical protein
LLGGDIIWTIKIGFSKDFKKFESGAIICREAGEREGVWITCTYRFPTWFNYVKMEAG